MLQAFLEKSADLQPHKTALVCGNQRYSFREIEIRANRLANQLATAGVKRGDRVAICFDNSTEAAISIFGVLKAGAIFLPLNPGIKDAKLAWILRDCGARLMLASPNRSVLSDVCPVISSFDDSEAAERPARQCIDIDLAAILYTSGSTGKPKGVMLTHRNMISAAESIIEYLSNRREDVILSVLPMSFNYGLYQWLMVCQFGGTLVLEKSFAYPWAVIETMQRERVTGFPLVPTMAAILLQLDLAKVELPDLRYITNAGAAIPGAHVQRLRAALPGVEIYCMYGQTEATRISYLPPDQIELRQDSVGRGIPNEEVWIVDDQGQRVPPGVVGELVVRGANVMKGYWNLPDETDRVLKPGPLPFERILYTGDLFRADEDGYLYFVARKDDIIKSRGEKVSPREVEDALCAIPEIAEAAVIGVPDAVLGEAVHAFAVLREGCVLDKQEIRRCCQQVLEDFMVPKIVEIVVSLPKLPNGKIDRRELCAGKRSR